MIGDNWVSLSEASQNQSEESQLGGSTSEAKCGVSFLISDELLGSRDSPGPPKATCSRALPRVTDKPEFLLLKTNQLTRVHPVSKLFNSIK